MSNCWEISSLCLRTGSSRSSRCSSVTSAILRQPEEILNAEFCARWSRHQLVSLCDGVLTGLQWMSIERPIAWLVVSKVSFSQPQVEPVSAFNSLLRCCTFTAILSQCCVKVRVNQKIGSLMATADMVGLESALSWELPFLLVLKHCLANLQCCQIGRLSVRNHVGVNNC